MMPANKPIEIEDNRFSSQAHPSAGESAVATPDNRLLAGYLAHEFLTRGTLFGNRLRTIGGDDTRPAKRPRPANGESLRVYAEVARLMQEEGLHLSGVVNPLQLAVHLRIV